MNQNFYAFFIGVLSVAAVCFSQLQGETMAKTAHPIVIIQTNKGDITVELDSDRAPVTVENFLKYVDEGFYDHTIFHRVIDGFMIQGGGFTADFKQKATHSPIKNEADNGLKNTKGTIAMARTNDINSATAQFFINVVDNPFLDFRSKNPSEYGYAVFGKVTKGMNVLDQIRKVKTGSKEGHQNVPTETVEILSIKRA